MARIVVWFAGFVLAAGSLGTAAAGQPQPKPEPACQVNYQGRDEEPPAERAWLSANFPWVSRQPLEVQLDQSYYYADEPEAHLLLRLNSQNLVQNGTFERDAWRRGWPDDWAKQSWEATKRCHLTPNDPQSVCLRLGEGLYSAWQDVKAVKPGQAYVVTFRGKSEAGKPAGYQILWDGGQKTAEGQLAAGDFKTYTVELTPSTSAPVTIKLWSGDPQQPGSAGVGYFAHVRMVAAGTDGKPAWPFAAADVKQLKARCTLYNIWGGGRDKLSEFTVEGFAADTTETKTIPLGPLPGTKLGRSFMLAVELLDKNGKAVVTAENKPLRAELIFGKIEPPRQTLEPIKKLEWTEDYACFVNGKPFFPIMLYNWYFCEFTERDWRVDMPEMRKMGFNTVCLADTALEKIKANNLYFLMSRPGAYVDNPTGKQLDRKVLNNARAQYGDWLLAYADSSEYAGSKAQVDAMIAQYATDKAIDADRPIIQCVQGPSPAKFTAYAQTAEIVWPEPHTHDGPFTVNFVQTALDKVHDVRGKKGGAWVECATYSPYGPPLLPPDAIRERAWAALARGARGIDWFAHHAHETDAAGRPCGRTRDMAPLSWSELRGLIAELQYLTPALCAPDHPGLSLTPDLADAVRRDVNGRIYIIAAPSFWYFKSKDKMWKLPQDQWAKWNWEPGPDGRLAHKTVVGDDGNAAPHGYFFGKIYSGLQKGDKLVQEIAIDNAAGKVDTVTTWFVGYSIAGDYYQIHWNGHLATWGMQAAIDRQATRSNPLQLQATPLPAPGKWASIEVDAAEVGLAGTDVANYNHGREWCATGSPGATVWWGRSLIRKANGRQIECYGPMPDNRITFTVEGLRPTSKVVSLLDGRVLPLEGNTFHDQLLLLNETGTSDRQVRLYEITP